MSKALLIAEKPSLMREIEKVYKKHKSEFTFDIDFMAQTGHLVTLKLPSEIDEEQKKWCWENLPFHPEEHGGWQYKIIQEKKTGKYETPQERYNKINKALHSGAYDFVINAGDPDQEGQLLIRLVLAQSKNTLPVKRFWTNALTEKFILDALKNLKDDDSDPMLSNLLHAAYCRQHSDYRFGMNLSEAASLKMNGRVAVGRVKTPILSIVCKREDEIKKFKPSTVYGVKAEYAEGFDGIYFDSSSASADENEKDEDQKNGIVYFNTKKEADDFIASLSKEASVLSFEKKKTQTYAPKLFKLATVQIAAGKLGINDADTLKIIQGLYEKQYLSYPRTDCEYLGSSEDFIGILKAVMSVPEFNPYIKTISKTDIARVRASKKWINDKALEESGHSALRPTEEAPDFEALSNEEQIIYSLICRQFVAMFLSPLVQEKILMIADVDGNTFRSTGKTLVDPGYTAIFGTKFSDAVVPEKTKGDILPINDFSVTEKTSKCPKRFTSPDLIAVCENPLKYLDDPALKALGKSLKIGTPATRSSIIRQLIDKDKYLQEVKEKKLTHVIPTKLGAAIIQNLGECEICKVDMTGIWEEKLEMVRSGKMLFDNLEKDMKSHVEELIQDIKDTSMTPFESSEASKYTAIGKCPKCGNDIISGPKGFYCAGFKAGCKMGSYKEVCGAIISDEEFMELLAGKEIIKTLAKGKSTWNQKLIYNEKESKIDFVKSEEKTSVYKCPCCDGELKEDDKVIKCDCGFKLWKTMCSKELSRSEIDGLLVNKKCGPVKGLQGKKRKFNAKLVVNTETKKIDFVFS